MKDREDLRTLVVATLRVHGSMSAGQLVDHLRQSAPKVLREERIGGAKSIAKVLQGFPEVTGVRNHMLFYSVFDRGTRFK